MLSLINMSRRDRFSVNNKFNRLIFMVSYCFKYVHALMHNFFFIYACKHTYRAHLQISDLVLISAERSSYESWKIQGKAANPLGENEKGGEIWRGRQERARKKKSQSISAGRHHHNLQHALKITINNKWHLIGPC